MPRPTPINKTCVKCQETKLIAFFERVPSGNWRAQCKACRTAWGIAHNLKIGRTGKKREAQRIVDENFAKGLKLCTQCKHLVKIEEFPKILHGRLKLKSWCHSCTKSYAVRLRNRYLPAKRLSSRESRAALRIEVLSYYSRDPFEPQCECCLENKIEFLALDHIYGGGNKHKKEVRHVFSWAKRNGYPPMFRVLCHNCNQSLGAYGYCPHEKEIPKTVAS